jgi:lipopolysaccharide/colanic/teichoic acid biosynthesis glycosyltransferase
MVVRGNAPMIENSTVSNGITRKSVLRAMSVKLPAAVSKQCAGDLGTVRQLNGIEEVLKRILDILVSFIALILLSPIMVLVALFIAIEDGSPVFYRQLRVGQHGREFWFTKFRSMRRDADAIKEQLSKQNEAGDVIFKMENDPRVTRVGRAIRRLSIDELPQLWLVLSGTMTLVGPRPHLPKEVDAYSTLQKSRLQGKPGLLCLREVTGRSRLTFTEWVDLDLEYLRHRSILLDCWVLLRVIPAVLKAEGAY